jgi:hypothetical protein
VKAGSAIKPKQTTTSLVRQKVNYADYVNNSLAVSRKNTQKEKIEKNKSENIAQKRRILN